MRPLFAIAPLAVVLALLGPTSQASQTDRSWTQTLLSWAFDQDETSTSSGVRSDTPRSFSSLLERPGQITR